MGELKSSLKETKEQLHLMESRLDKVESRLHRVEGRQGRVEGRLHAEEKKTTELTEGLGAVNIRVDGLQCQVKQLQVPSSRVHGVTEDGKNIYSLIRFFFIKCD